MAREFMVTGLRTIAMSEGIVIAAGQEGKYKTAFQVAAITFLLIHYTYPIDAIVFSFDLDANRVGTWLLYVSLFFSRLVGLDLLPRLRPGGLRPRRRPPPRPGRPGRAPRARPLRRRRAGTRPLTLPGGASINGLLRESSCGNSSVVEHRLAKARVEGSNPFSRSI